jgi:hypothetical protein
MLTGTACHFCSGLIYNPRVNVEAQTDHPSDIGVLPRTANITGRICLVPSAAFAMEVIYEQTLLTQAKGPQMIGFSLAHEHIGFLLLGAAGILGTWAWLFGFISRSIFLRIKGKYRASKGEWTQFLIATLIVAAFCVPYEVWQFTSISLLGPGAKPADLLCAAAIEDHRYLIDKILEAHVNIDAPNSYGRTALESACVTGQKQIADYLVLRGASLDTAQSCRRFQDFGTRMKPIPSAPDDGILKVPGDTVIVSGAPRN